MSRRFLLALCLGAACGQALAATCTSTGAGTVSWLAAATWTSAGNCNRVPLASDDVVITNAVTAVQIDTGNAVAQSLAINSGTLQFNNATARTLTVSRTGSASGTGNITVANGATFNLVNVNQSGHQVILDGNLTNNGTFNMAVSATARAIVTFNRSSAAGVTQNLTGTGATTNFRTITVNMAGGGGTANIVDVTGLSNLTFTNGSVLTMTAGPLKLDSAVSIPSGICPTGATAIPSGARIWLNNAGASVTCNAAMTVVAGGTLQVDAGSFSSTAGALTVAGTATSAGTFSVTASVTVTGTLQVTGGTFTDNGALTVTGGTLQIDGGAVSVGTAVGNNLTLTSNAATSFKMNGGTLGVSGGLQSSAVGASGSYNQTNGVVTVGTVNGANQLLFRLGTATTFTMSGGSIVVQNLTSAANEVDIRSTTQTVTGGTLQFGNASSPAAGGASMFFTNSAGGSVTVWNLVIWSSPNPQSATIFVPTIVMNDLTIQSGASLVCNAAAATINLGSGNNSGVWSNSGTFTNGGSTVTFSGTNANQAISGTAATTFNNLTHSNTSAAGIAMNVNATVNGTLNFTNAPAATTINTGSNTLTIGNAGSISGPATSRHVVGNLARNYTAIGTFTYAVGDGTNYTPVTVQMTALGTAGNLTVSTPSPAASVADHPNTTSGVSGVNPSNSVNRYWTLKNSTLAGTYTITVNYLSGSPVDLDSGATPASFIVSRGTSCSGSGTSRNCGGWTSPTLNGVPTSTQASASGITIASGDADVDFVVGVARSVFSREKEFIYTRETF